MRRWTRMFLSDYGMLLVLLVLCGFYSVATLQQQFPGGTAAGRELGRQVLKTHGRDVKVLVVTRSNREDMEFADAFEAAVRGGGGKLAGRVAGQPPDARAALEKLAGAGENLEVVACSSAAGSWAVFDRLGEKFPGFRSTRVVQPRAYRWPNFLKADNLLNVANQIAVIAIIAIGMTLVIITAGIDLSVGSLIALSAVIATLLIQQVAGAEQAGTVGLVLSCAAAVVACGLVGLFSGVMVTAFRIPAFIATLAMMLVASGLAFILAKGQSIYQVPDTFLWLGRGADLGLPNAVVLMLVLYVIAHLVMTRMPIGRYIYAVGGNMEAARLAGVPVARVLLLVYAVSGALAGLGGIVMASQLKSGAPTYGQMYELYVIAAVVVGGTSLAGGEGKVLGTLIGAFIIAVIQNGMNLTGVESYTQKVVLGLVILGAVLLDNLKRRSWRRSKRGAKSAEHVEITR